MSPLGVQKKVTGLRFDERLEEKVARAVEMSGWPKADILRMALSRGLDDLAEINYDIDGAIAAAVRAAKEPGGANATVLLENQGITLQPGRKAL